MKIGALNLGPVTTINQPFSQTARPYFDIISRQNEKWIALSLLTTLFSEGKQNSMGIAKLTRGGAVRLIFCL